MATSPELAASMAQRVKIQRQTCLSWTDLDASQTHFLANKITPHLIKDEHGMPGTGDFCLVLPALGDKSREHKETTVLKRTDRPLSSKPRGAYLKAPYSFSGSYAQVTLNKKENERLQVKSTKRVPPFPKTRTFQATHVILRNGGFEPPVMDRFIYTASHLCGFASCLRADHLIWEKLADNWSRRMCHSYCVAAPCLHVPKCFYRASDHLDPEAAAQVQDPGAQDPAQETSDCDVE